MFNNQPTYDGSGDPNQQWGQQPGQPQMLSVSQVSGGQAPPSAIGYAEDEGDSSNARRPPNAFILYSQQMRTQVRQEHPQLSNTEVSSLLGKMWKDVPNETKIQYKETAQKLQDSFKKSHPDYTYRKARRKRALNELLTKSQGNFAMGENSFLAGYQPMNGIQPFSTYPMFPMPGQQMQPPMAQPMAPGIPQQMQGQIQTQMYPGMQYGQKPE